MGPLAHYVSLSLYLAETQKQEDKSGFRSVTNKLGDHR